MGKRPDERPKKGFLRDSVQIWDEKYLEYEEAWEHRFNKRKEVIVFRKFDAIDVGPYMSEGFFCAPYRNALVMINLHDTVGAPTTLLFTAWFSWDNVNWFWYMENWWGDCEWEDTALPRHECMPIPILAPYIQFRIGITGGSAQAYFPVDVRVIFNSV